MKRKRFSVEQIVEILKQVEVGVPVAGSPAHGAAGPAIAPCHKSVILSVQSRWKLDGLKRGGFSLIPTGTKNPGHVSVK